MDKSVFDIKPPDIDISVAMKKTTSDIRKSLSQKSIVAPRREALTDSDAELKRMLDRRTVRTLIVGVGGAGNNMISRFQEAMNPGCRTICVNTDVQDLYYSNADEKILIGKRLTRGLGAGNDHITGELAASEDFERIKMIMEGDLVFLACGLGGGTGTGATPLIAKAAKERGAVVVSIVTLPFKMEGTKKGMVALQGLNKLAKHSDTIIPLPNQRLLSLVPDLKLHQGFKIMDEILVRSVSGTVDLITKPGLVNLDFADIKSIIEKRRSYNNELFSSPSVIGMTEVSQFSESHLIKYTTRALNNPLIDPETTEIKNALVGIAGDYNVNLKQVNTIVSAVSDQIHPSANIKWGFIQNPTLKGKMKITIMGNGFDSKILTSAIENFGDV
ncbi:MAG: cell division protein FtsZ [Candidatus Hodarchaeota archaeon]